jgi:hypothetical protein
MAAEFVDDHADFTGLFKTISVLKSQAYACSVPQM